VISVVIIVRLSPVPNLQTKHNVADARKKDTESIKSSSSSKVSPTVPEKPLLKSQPSAENQPTKTPAAVEKARDSVLASIVEDSVQLLVTGLNCISCLLFYNAIFSFSPDSMYDYETTYM